MLVNWLDVEFVRALDVVTTAATIFISCSFCILILITEIYGYKLARLAIWWNVLLNILLIILGEQLTIIPGSSLTLYNNIVVSSTKLILASVVAAFFSQHVNAYLQAKMKINMKDDLVSRFILPAILSSGLDSLLVNAIAFYKTMNTHHMISIVTSVWFTKMFIILMTTPILVKLSKKLKSIEKIDIYDINTQFNPFATESRYTSADNFFDRSHADPEPNIEPSS